MDSVLDFIMPSSSFQANHILRMLGSLTFYRQFLLENVFSNPSFSALIPFGIRGADDTSLGAVQTLPTVGHAVAGVMAGVTVSFIASPIEHIKARLQIQYAADKTNRLYSGPIDCTKKIVRFIPFPPLSGLKHALIIYTGTAPNPRSPRPLPWPICHPPLPLLLLLLVGFLRPPHPPPLHNHLPLHPLHQLLGRRSLCPSFLAYLLPLRCRQAAYHDGPAWRPARRRAAHVSPVAGCGYVDLEA